MNQSFKPEDIFDVELPPSAPEPPATIEDTRTWQVLSVIGRALLVGFALIFAILAIWGPSTRTDHQ